VAGAVGGADETNLTGLTGTNPVFERLWGLLRRAGRSQLVPRMGYGPYHCFGVEWL